MKKTLLITLILSTLVLSACQKADVIGKDKAKEIALEHANLTEAQVNFAKTELNRDDGRQVYEVEFYTDDFTEYDYEIDASNGDIISFDADAEGFSPNKQPDINTAPTNDIPAEVTEITEANIKAKVLEKVPGATEDDIWEFHKDLDDGMELYEGKIIFDNNEYEFEVNAKTGEIISWESESIFD